MFFDREKGFGILAEKKDKGYSRWAKDKEVKKELSCGPLKQKNCKEAGVPILLNKEEMWVDNGEYHTLVIGATGAGKTTMVNLLMKFYDINKGDIIIDGVSTKELTRENIHELFIMVLLSLQISNHSVMYYIGFRNKLFLFQLKTVMII